MSIVIIAEAGINHNGDLGAAKDLIDVAAHAGANIVKFQKRTIERCYSREYLASRRESPWGTTQGEQKRHLEFGRDEYNEIDRYCRQIGIEWMASAWDIEALAFLDAYKPRYQKVASAMLRDAVFLRAVATRRIRTFVSTGGASLDLIDRAVSIFDQEHCPFELMHCVATYPMKDTDANLRAIYGLRERFGCDVGYSGHETGLQITLAAAAMGASSIERHITLNRASYGSDQAASVEPEGLVRLVRDIRIIEAAMGDGDRRVSDAERAVMEKLWACRPAQ